MTTSTALPAAGTHADAGPGAPALHAMQRAVLEAIAAGRPLAMVTALLCQHLARYGVCAAVRIHPEGERPPLASSGDYAPATEDEPCACHSVPVRTPDGRVVGALVCRSPSGAALPEEVQTEAAHLAALAIDHEAVLVALRAASRRFENATEALPHGVCFLDGARRLIAANRRFAAIYDLDATALHPGMAWHEIMALRTAAGSAPSIAAGDGRRRDGLADGVPVDGEVELANGRVVAVRRRPVGEDGWVVTHEEVTEQRRAEARIVYLAQHDALTGLPNRALFQERLQQALGRAAPGQQCAVLSLDLDRFKTVNESLGHAAGDQVLQLAAARLRGSVRDRDMATRTGGDKFAILLVGIAGPEAAAEVAQRIHRALGEPYALGETTVEVGASIGIAVTPGDGLQAETVLRSAEVALYRAKAEERGSYRFFEAGMDVRLHARIALKADLRAAIDAGQFDLWYQPLIGRSGTICGCEALLRWRHPVRGIVSPAEFIPLAEETGLILPLGDWVLRRACAEAAGWPENIKVAVNLSPAQFRRRSLVETVRAALADAGLPAARLELEITESLLLANTEATLGMLHDLRTLGVGIAMDDFGSGYSSLRYLRSFPFDKVKIDRSFIRDLPDKADSIAIVRAVVTLCRSLGIATTAEGVETEHQMRHLREEGCTELQGFLFSRPRPAAEIAPLLRQAVPRWGGAV